MVSTEPEAETDEASGTDDSREQGIDIGPLADQLETHSYPTTTSDIVEEYGDYEIELPDGSRSLGDVLGGLEGEDEEYDSADEVRQMIYNMVGSDAVGREGYSDRGGLAGGDESDESDGKNDGRTDDDRSF